MKLSKQLECIAIIIDGLSKDIDEWEKNGCPAWSGGYHERVNATHTGIQERIKIIRSMLLQVSKDVLKKVK